MYKAIKFTETEDNRIFFTSDTHFCHDRDFVVGPRGYNSVDEMNEDLIRKWNETVRPTDTVIHLGDFILGAGKDSDKRFKEIIHRLNGNIIYLWGNHNAGVKQYYRDLMVGRFCDARQFDEQRMEVYPVGEDTANGSFSFRGNNLYLQIKTLEGKKVTVFCAHFAHRLWIDCHHDRIIHLSGHSHGSDPESQPDHKVGKRLDVGVDNFGRPININEVLKVTNKMTWEDFDHHNEDTNPS